MNAGSFRTSVVAAAVLLTASCSDSSLPTAPLLPERGIVDGPSTGLPNFYWLPPVVPSATYAGTFDFGVSPVVRIYECVGTDCDFPVLVATSGIEFTAVRVITKKGQDPYFHAKWETAGLGLVASNLHRIKVHIGSAVLGYADVQIVMSPKQADAVDRSEYVPLVYDGKLDINFRIETGGVIVPVATVEVTPASATIAEGATQQFTATLRDAAANELTGRTVSWSSSNTSVATVDNAGLVTGVAAGTATITATSEGVSDDASLTVQEAFMRRTISGGAFHSCGITTTGAAYCWGQNDIGQLGNPTNIGTLVLVTAPVPVAGELIFTEISVGLAYTCGLTAAGAAYCWGYNEIYGTLGNGTLANSSVPVAVAGGHTFSRISTSYLHTCGVTTQNTLYCWGNNDYGQLGDGTQDDRFTPVLVPGNWSQVSTAAYHTCAISTAGAAYCWGYSGAGLGNGTNYTPSPLLVTGGLTYKQIGTGTGHTVALTTTGTAYAWGSNYYGQLGDGTTTSRTAPVPVLGGLVFTQIAVGGNHVIALTAAGAAYAWGSNDYGELGNGSSLASSLPVAVSGGQVFQQVAAADAWLSFGVTTTGSGYGWGFNGKGNLGDGTTSHRNSPTPITGGLTFK